MKYMAAEDMFLWLMRFTVECVFCWVIISKPVTNFLVRKLLFMSRLVKENCSNAFGFSTYDVRTLLNAGIVSVPTKTNSQGHIRESSFSCETFAISNSFSQQLKELLIKFSGWFQKSLHNRAESVRAYHLMRG